jgi:hypothetical protein
MKPGDRGALWALGFILLATVATAAFATYAPHYALQQSENSDWWWQDPIDQWGQFAGGLLAAFFAYRAFLEARRSNLITREMGEAQVRAYIFCSEANYKIGAQKISVTLTVKNVGQSPAPRCDCKGFVRCPKPPNQMHRGKATEFFRSAEATGSVELIPTGTDARLEVVWQAPAEELIDALLTARAFFDVECQLTWQDVFERQQTIPLVLSAPYSTTLGGRSGSLDIATAKAE